MSEGTDTGAADNVTHLADRRWKGHSSPGAYKPEEALHAALRAIETGESTPSHIIVIMTGSDQTRYLQAGEAGTLEQLGLIERIKHMMLTPP